MSRRKPVDGEKPCGRESPAAASARLDAAVLAAADGGRLACPAALALARKLGVGPLEIGLACDRLGLKITSCQLGCFGRAKESDETS